MLSATTKAFVDGNDNLKNLLGNDHAYYSYDKAIEGKMAFPESARKTLCDNLQTQYQAIAGKEHVDTKVWDNIQKLSQANTFTVTTGQQLHLFFGPAFVIYKIMALVDTCEALKQQYPDKNFVPVYWPASEDHDFDEIKNTKVFNQTFTWNANAGDACGRLKTDTVKQLIEDITQKVNLTDEHLKLLSEFNTIYASSENLTEATIRVVNAFMGQYGVICVNGDQRVFKQEFVEVMKRDLKEQRHQLVFEEVSKAMLAFGLSTQLNARPINFFYLHEGTRQRIVFENGQYVKADGTPICESIAIDDLIDQYPERFSPNAMMRPLYQESILPNIAYLGGNAEITYWIQLCNVMAINNISHPKLILRPSVWISPAKTLQWLEKRNILPLQLLTSRNKEDLLALIAGNVPSLEQEITAFNTLRSSIQNTTAQTISSELKNLVEAGKVYEKELKNIDKMIREAGIANHAQTIEKLQDIKDNLFSINTIQERKIDSLEMLIKYKDVVFSIKNDLKLRHSEGYIISM